MGKLWGFIGFGVFVAVCSPATADWGTTQADAGHTGYVPMTVSASSPTLLWSDSGMLVQSSFAVGGGDVFFVTHASGTGFANNLYTVDEKTGSIVRQRPPASTAGDPAYANGVVYLQNAGGLNLVQGWNTQTGAQVFSASYSNQGNTYLAPVISNGSVYAGGGYYGGQVYSYNASTSATNWVSNVPYSGSYGGAAPALDANYVYATGGGGSDLLILDRSTGALVSETGNHNEASSGSPVLTGNGGVFYIENGNGYHLNVSNPASPQVDWTFPQLSEWSYPAYANGTIYLSAEMNTTPTLYAVDAATGNIDWSLAGAEGLKNLIVTDNALFASEGTNTVAINLATHQVMWSVPYAGPMALSDGELFIGTQGNVVAYAVPEPSTLVVLAPLAAGAFLRRRVRQ